MRHAAVSIVFAAAWLLQVQYAIGAEDLWPSDDHCDLTVCTLVATAQLANLVSNAAYAPNQQLGTCLDDAWVTKVETELSISRYDRDAKGRLVHPHLRAALQTPRFKAGLLLAALLASDPNYLITDASSNAAQVTDPRTAKATSSLYRADCKATGSIFYGAGATVDANGNVVDPGRVNGTLVLELKGWESASLMTMIFAIIAEELVRCFRAQTMS